ncbi:hypothetical protein OG455_02610 [Kitasatospora sp. NBC_01287]|uniref:hypothetical protein n=1 Tax=Kitasatospora sp. NBC_01287 TaxID=2903573 RepID=UPI00224E0852|nr:hypothetical protein [Kitasatospora sp. NBC_01287]MCX4744418.1 hypothetical protein [Kitasatospora sp. NBC_01287]
MPPVDPCARCPATGHAELLRLAAAFAAGAISGAVMTALLRAHRERVHRRLALAVLAEPAPPGPWCDRPRPAPADAGWGPAWP